MLGTGRGEEALVVYSGRSQSLVEPLVTRFEAETGIPVRVRYGSSAQLGIALREEGARSPADVFWAQESGVLEHLHQHGFLAVLEEESLLRVADAMRHEDGVWVGTSGRARVIAYSTERVAPGEVPDSIFDLVAPEWADRVGWAPTNASFQASVTAMRLQVGDVRTQEWLRAMRANGARAYANNTAVVQAVAAGEVDVALTNHYYLLRFLNDDSSFPVSQAYFRAQDPGNLINFAGAGVLRSSHRQDAANAFVQFLLASAAQEYFATEIFEYPVVGDVPADPSLLSLDELMALSPPIGLRDLEDLDGTLALMREAGLL